MPEIKYLYFAVLGIATFLCVVICSIFFKSSKVVQFPHIELFGKPLRFITRFIPYSILLLVVLLTIIAIHPYKTKDIFSEKKVYNIVVCLDVSNSMKEKNKLEIAKKVLRDFVLKRDNEDRIGIVVFDNIPFRLVSLTTDRKKILKLIPSIHPAMVDKGGTSMYDALIESLDVFKPEWENKIVILLSDGGDIDSKHTLDDVIRYNKVVKAKIYTIGISSGIHSYALERLSVSSGGKAFFITTEYKTALENIFNIINHLEPSVIKETSYKIEEPVDFYIKIAALLLGFFILAKITYRAVKDEKNTD